MKPHRNEASRGLFATAELLVSVSRFAEENRLNLFLRIGKSQGEVTNNYARGIVLLKPTIERQSRAASLRQLSFLSYSSKTPWLAVAFGAVVSSFIVMYTRCVVKGSQSRRQPSIFITGVCPRRRNEASFSVA